MEMTIACKVSKFFFFFILPVFWGSFMAAFAGDFNQGVEVTWGGDRAKIFNGGNALSLTLDKASGSGFQSKSEYLFGRIDMEIKLVAGNSAGTVTTYYLSSQGPYHDEIDFEFLGNLSGDPYTVHTNIYAQGEGDREQQFHLWFDPTKDFHLYSIIWNPHRIIFLVDNIPMRVYENEEPIGVPFPNKQPMKLYSSLWNADQWATRGGQVKTDWSNAPFTAYYRNFKANACLWSSLSASSSSCSASPKTTSTTGSAIEGVGASSGAAWQTQVLDANARRRLRWVQKYYMIYNYCADYKRFPQGRPRECRRARFF